MPRSEDDEVVRTLALAAAVLVNFGTHESPEVVLDEAKAYENYIKGAEQEG